ncbi:MAG: zinc ribbon domain-containing protein [Chloroflexota bacterium]
MELGAIVVGLILLAGGMYFVMKPFDARGRRRPQKIVPRFNPDEGRVAALSALRDLDFDFRTGKVSEEDYPALRARLVEKAAQYLELEKEEDDRIEALVQARKAVAKHEDDKIEALVQARKAVAKHGRACAKCGRKLEAEARFCSHCGAEAGAACPSCGEAIKSEDRFCVSCGTRLVVQAEAA